MQNIRQYINDLRNEKNGLSFDQPWRIEEGSLSVLIPIINSNQNERKYITFNESTEIEIKDTGQIDYVHVKNNSNIPVLMCRGDILIGKTQERTVIHDYIVMPNKSVRVSVRCINKSKGINSNANMTYNGRVSSKIDLSSQTSTWNTISNIIDNYYCAISTKPSLSVTHNEEALYNNYRTFTTTNTLHSFNNNDNYVNMLDDTITKLKEAMKKIPPIINQVGVVFFEDNDLLGLEIYDSEKSWSALKEDIISKEGTSFLSKDNENLFEFRPEAAKKIINKKLDVIFEERDIYNKEYNLVEIKSEKYIGEGLIWGDDIIHLSMWKRK